MAEFKGSKGIKRVDIGYTDGTKAEAVFLDVFGKYQREIVAETLSNLVYGSPEETGTLKDNWAVKPGRKPGSRYVPNTGRMRNWQSHLDQELSKIAGYQRAFSYYTIYNNSEYVNYVDAGVGNNSRNQAFIDRALAKTKGKLG